MRFCDKFVALGDILSYQIITENQNTLPLVRNRWVARFIIDNGIHWWLVVNHEFCGCS